MKRSMLVLMITLSMAVVVSLGVSTLPQPAQSGKPIALVGGTLIDGFGGPPIRNSVVLVRGERIAAVGQVGALAVPADFEVISTEGMSVLPGLWDMHVHLMINGHSDYTHWDKTYPARQETSHGESAQNGCHRNDPYSPSAWLVQPTHWRRVGH